MARAGRAADAADPALVTDIGNDLMYEAPIDQIAAWVERCSSTNFWRNVRIVMTRLPVGNIDHVPEWKFRVLRRLMFPKGSLPYATIAARARELDERLVDLAAAHNVTLVEQQRAWYGWDPIHLKSQVWPTAWHTILSPLTGGAVAPPRRIRAWRKRSTCAAARRRGGGGSASSSEDASPAPTG